MGPTLKKDLVFFYILEVSISDPFVVLTKAILVGKQNIKRAMSFDKQTSGLHVCVYGVIYHDLLAGYLLSSDRYIQIQCMYFIF